MRRGVSEAAGVAVGVAGGALGFVLGIPIGDVAAPSGGLETLGTLLVVVVLCTWAGASLGAAIGVRIAGEAPRRSPVVWTFVLLLPIGGAGLYTATALSDSDDNVPFAVQAAIVVLSVMATWFIAKRVAAAMAAR